MVITSRQQHSRGLPPLNLLLKSQVIEHVSEHRHLDVIIDDQLKRQAHINCNFNTVANNVDLLSRLKHFYSAEAFGKEKQFDRMRSEVSPNVALFKHTHTHTPVSYTHLTLPTTAEV